jgi:hypothetical protein
MTLVTAYERLIGGRGRPVRDTVVATASIGAPAMDGQSAIAGTANIALPNAMVAPEDESGRDHKTASAAHCETHVVRGHRRRLCEPDFADSRERGRHRVRSVDRGVSHHGHRARHNG